MRAYPGNPTFLLAVLAITTACQASEGPVFGRPGCLSCASLPLVVDHSNHFTANGYTGDWKAIQQIRSDVVPNACIPERAHDQAVGACHHFTWTFSGGICPIPSQPEQPCEPYACVAWLKPSDFYTASVPNPDGGLPIAPGAKEVGFWAWAPQPTRVRFSVGSPDEGVNAAIHLELTPTPTRYAIDISRGVYGVVNTGFMWCVSDVGVTHTDFYVDDIEWR